MLQEYLSIFRRNLPYVIRTDESALALFSHEKCRFLEKRDDNGALLALLCYCDNVILLLCVDEPYRKRGWGSELLSIAEDKIHSAGFDEVCLGAGFSYLVPGVPTHRPQFPTTSEGAISPVWEDCSAFFEKRGYLHSWDCNCFDMARKLSRDEAFLEDGHLCFAELSEKDAVSAMMEKAHASFAKYYRNEALYQDGSASRVLAFYEDGKPIGALIVTQGKDSVGLVGCVAVLHAARGQGVATRLVRHATCYLARRGANFAFVGYTYSGMERLYGKCGYEISSYYLMGKKKMQ